MNEKQFRTYRIKQKVAKMCFNFQKTFINIKLYYNENEKVTFTLGGGSSDPEEPINRISIRIIY